MELEGCRGHHGPVVWCKLRDRVVTIIQVQDDACHPECQVDATTNRGTSSSVGSSQADKAASHERIVKAASRRIRRDGIDNVSVAELMNQAGLTHGGFYRHFDSRDELVAEAIDAALAQGSRARPGGGQARRPGGARGHHRRIPQPAPPRQAGDRLCGGRAPDRRRAARPARPGGLFTPGAQLHRAADRSDAGPRSRRGPSDPRRARRSARAGASGRRSRSVRRDPREGRAGATPLRRRRAAGSDAAASQSGPPPPSPTLSASQLARLAELGEERTADVGDVLYQVGDRDYPFMAIIEGEVAILDAAGNEIVRHGASGFLGELNLLSGQTVFVTAVVTTAAALHRRSPRGAALAPVRGRPAQRRRAVGLHRQARRRFSGSRDSVWRSSGRTRPRRRCGCSTSRAATACP